MCSAEVRFLGRYVSQDCEWENPEVQVEGNGDCDVAGRQGHKLKTDNLSATPNFSKLFPLYQYTNRSLHVMAYHRSFSGNSGYVLVPVL
jgi:hypothetical protein